MFKTFIMTLILFSSTAYSQGQTDLLTEWAKNKEAEARKEMKEGSTSKRVSQFVDYYFPEKLVELNASPEDMENARKTKELFHTYFPANDPSSFVGTFFEGGHPYVLTKYGPWQWDSMEDSGMNDHVLFRKVIKKLVKHGIKSFRLAPLLHKDNQKEFLEKIRIIWEEGGTPIITIVWFPSFKKWEIKDKNGKIIFPESYILNTEWPSDIGKLTNRLMTAVWKLASEIERQKGRTLTALINGVNEPETLAAFNRHFWHGGFANYFHPEKLRYYIISTIRIGEANVHIRRAVEETNGGRKILFMHNEAMAPDYYPSHNRLGKYLVSKLMLGDDSLIHHDYSKIEKESLSKLKDRLTALKSPDDIEWALKEFIFGSWNKTDKERETARKYILSEFGRLKDLHLKLKEDTGVKVKTNSILYLDYYYQTEFLPGIPVPELADKMSSIPFLKKVLLPKDDNALLEMLKVAVTKVDKDYAPQGPEGPVLPFTAKSLKELDLKKLLSQNDYLILERLVGLRREYTFVKKNLLHERRMMAGIGDDEKIIFRTDHYLDQLLKDDASLLKKVMKVKSIEELHKSLNLPLKSDIREALDKNGRKLFNQIFGLERVFMLGFEPQHYARQIRAGIRYGFYHFFLQYIKNLKLYTVGVGESGTPYYFYANLLHNQIMLEYVEALKNGLYGTQYVFGPAVDTVGWARSPLGHHWKEDHEVNPSGILKIENGEPVFRGDDYLKTEWPLIFLDSVFRNMKK